MKEFWINYLMLHSLHITDLTSHHPALDLIVSDA